jgi:hypothetical protein
MLSSRDIVTKQDVAAFRFAAATEARSQGSAEQAADTDRKLGGELVVLAGRQPPSPDAWQQRLLKYIPGEAIGMYVVLDKAVQATGKDGHTQFWLVIVLVGAVAFNVLYLLRIWKLHRPSQILVSTGALLAYIYATGGAFASISTPVSQIVVLILAAAFLIFFEPPGQGGDLLVPSSTTPPSTTTNG